MSITRTDLAVELANVHDIDDQAAAEAVTVYAAQLGAGHRDLLAAEDADRIRRALEAHLAHDVGAPLDAVADATSDLRAMQTATEDADRTWRQAIRAAVEAGQRVVDVAEAAGVSRERVYQIRDSRR